MHGQSGHNRQPDDARCRRGRIGGRGLYHAVDLVGSDRSPIVPEDRAFDFTGDLSATPTAIVRNAAAKHGVWLTGFVPNTIKVAPPLTVTADEIDLTLEAFDAGLEELTTVTLAEVSSSRNRRADIGDVGAGTPGLILLQCVSSQVALQIDAETRRSLSAVRMRQGVRGARGGHNHEHRTPPDSRP